MDIVVHRSVLRPSGPYSKVSCGCKAGDDEFDDISQNHGVQGPATRNKKSNTLKPNIAQLKARIAELKAQSVGQSGGTMKTVAKEAEEPKPLLPPTSELPNPAASKNEAPKPKPKPTKQPVVTMAARSASTAALACAAVVAGLTCGAVVSGMR